MPYAFTNWSLLSDHLPVYFLCFGACSMHAFLEWLSPKNCSLQPGSPLSLVWALSAVFVPFARAVAHLGSVLWQLVKFPPFVHTPKTTWLLWIERGRGTGTSVEWNDLTHFVQSARQDALNETELTCMSPRFCGHRWFAVTEEFQSPIPTFYDSEGHRFSREGRRDMQEQGLCSVVEQ